MQNAACSLPLFGVSLSPIDVSSFCILFPTLKAHLVTSPGRLKPEVSTNSFVFIFLLTVVNSSCLSRNRYLYWLKNICLKLISSSWSSGSSFSHMSNRRLRENKLFGECLGRDLGGGFFFLKSWLISTCALEQGRKKSNPDFLQVALICSVSRHKDPCLSYPRLLPPTSYLVSYHNLQTLSLPLLKTSHLVAWLLSNTEDAMRPDSIKWLNTGTSFTSQM